MRQRALYIVIGLLLGIILAQWSLPVAQGQTTKTQSLGSIKVTSLTLVDSKGKTLAKLFGGSQGPILSMGSTTGPSVSLGTTSTNAGFFVASGKGRTASLFSGGTQNWASLSVSDAASNGAMLWADGKDGNLDVNGVYLPWVTARVSGTGHKANLWASSSGGALATMYADGITGTVPGASAKPVAAASWGQIKVAQGPAPRDAAGKTAVRNDEATEYLGQVQQEYQQAQAQVDW